MCTTFPVIKAKKKKKKKKKRKLDTCNQNKVF